jgi:hypothetical protein
MCNIFKVKNVKEKSKRDLYIKFLKLKILAMPNLHFWVCWIGQSLSLEVGHRLYACICG